MQFKVLRNAFLIMALILGGFYLATIVYLSQSERQMIFFPDKQIHSTPADSAWSFEDIFVAIGPTTNLHGWKITGADTTTNVVSVFYHGNAGNISHNMSYLSLLRRFSKVVYAFDYSGYGRSDGNIETMDFYTDVSQTFSSIIDKDSITIENIILYGHSLGSHAALYLASNYPVRTVVIDGAFTSIADRAAELYSILPIHSIMDMHFDSKPLIAEIESPVLIIAGKKDQVVPWQHGLSLFTAAASPKDSIFIAEGTHSNTVYALMDSLYGEFATKLRLTDDN
jgi:pimeloyl-ACP methyl ester carboxylesterase